MKRWFQFFRTGFLVSNEFKLVFASYYFYDCINVIALALIFSYVDSTKTLTYYILYFLVQLTNLFNVWKFRQVSMDIRRGDLLIYLSKPINYLSFRFFNLLGLDFGRTIIYLSAIGAISIIMHLTIINLLTLVIFMIFVSILEYLYYMLLYLLSFFVYEVKPFVNIMTNIQWFIAGAYIPATFFTPFLKTFADYTLFSFMGYRKLEVLLNGCNAFTMDLFVAYTLNLTLLFALCSLLWKIGLKHFESQGG